MKRFTNILCIVASCTPQDPAWLKGLALAKANQARLTVASVLERLDLTEGGYGSAVELAKQLVDSRDAALQALVSTYEGTLEVQSKLFICQPHREMSLQIEEEGYDLLIKSVDEENDLFDRFLGTDDMRLLRYCRIPVWLLKPKVSHSFQRIVAALDLDHEGDKACRKRMEGLNRQLVEMASSLALEETTELHLIYAWETWAESLLGGSLRAGVSEATIDEYIAAEMGRHQRYLTMLMDQAQEWLGEKTFGYVNPKPVLLRGNPRRVILDYVEQFEADLVVMGTVGRSGMPGLFIGNTAESILNQLDCSVLAVKPGDFVSPLIPN